MRQNHKKINLLQPKNITKPSLLQAFISSVIQFVKFFHPVVLYENYLICMFMNINENLQIKEIDIALTNIQGGNQTYIEHIGHFIMGVNLFN